MMEIALQSLICIILVCCSFVFLKGEAQFESSAFCTPPPSPANGGVSLEGGHRIIRYSCNEGFELVGTAVSICLSGKWTSYTPKCLSKHDAKDSKITPIIDRSAFPLDAKSSYEKDVNPSLHSKGLKKDDRKSKRKERRKNKIRRKGGRKKERSLRRRKRMKNKKVSQKKDTDIFARNLLKDGGDLQAADEKMSALQGLQGRTATTKRKERRGDNHLRRRKQKRKRMKKGKRRKKKLRKKVKTGGEELPAKQAHSGQEISHEDIPNVSPKVDAPSSKRAGSNLDSENLSKVRHKTDRAQITTPNEHSGTSSYDPTSTARTGKSKNSIHHLEEETGMASEDVALGWRSYESTSSAAASIIESEEDLLQDIIDKMPPPREVDSSNLFDIIMRRRLKKERDGSEAKQSPPSDPPTNESAGAKSPISAPHKDNDEDSAALPSNRAEELDFAPEQSRANDNRDDDYDQGSPSDYEENYEGGGLPEGYPGDYRAVPSSVDDNLLRGSGQQEQERTSSSFADLGHDISLTEELLDLDRRHSPGFFPTNKTYSAEDDVMPANQRFSKEENINFSELDSSCVISELDSLYLPSPSISHGHATEYMLVTNPAKPHNVYVEVIYECGFGFRVSESTANRLFCRKNRWIGILPECVPYESDTGECGTNNGGCEQICKKFDQKLSCSCYRGFKLSEENGASCQDIDECLVNNGGCEAVCFNKRGSHQCFCPTGYRLSTNGKTCVDKNECILRNGHGPCQDTCRNSEGSYICSCEGIPGTKLASDKHTCEDVDECSFNNGGCSHVCLNTFGQTFCDCPEGFVLSMDWKTCKDINECDFDQICDANCINTPGSYLCTDYEETLPSVECRVGFLVSEDFSFCQDIDECSAEENPCSHLCFNTEGSFLCGCPQGLMLGPDQYSCLDINECASGNGDCAHLCNNDIGSYTCSCKEGYTLEPDGKSCHDVDECSSTSRSNSLCNQECVNTEGSYTCSCFEGYELEDSSNCIDINECSLSKCQHDCLNLPGAYECLCYDGYHLHSDNSTCVDVDECEKGNKCSHFCSNEAGSYTCKCPIGFSLKRDGYTCIDINECEDASGGCSSICVNTDGGYHCDCSPGTVLMSEGTTFERKHMCIDIDECELLNGNCSHICDNREGSFVCRCPEGMTFSRSGTTISSNTCEDIDECQANNGGCSHRCINKEGSYLCQCPKGLILSSDGLTCDDVNECLHQNGGCSHKCVNLPATYECTCPTGWNFDYDEDYDGADATYPEGFEALWKTCIDVNECDSRNGGCSHECVNEAGGFYCKCPIGFNLINDYSCEDINECLVENGGCSHTCLNNEGSYECLCEKGFTNQDKKQCIDVDECSTGSHECSHTCRNVVGRYVCFCPQGFILEPDGVTCTDLNECGNLNGGCSHVCHNSFGEYTCSCPSGWTLSSDDHTCLDINECEDATGGCSHDCHNEEGSFTCSCPEGLALGVNQKSCLDIDECGSYNGGCSHQCTNKEGYYLCLCPNGLALGTDGHTCQDINECLEENGGCSDECQNTLQDYSCLCPVGFILGADNRTCQDVDECLLEKGGCSHQCYNMRGSYRCECPTGFELSDNGFTCNDVDECKVGISGCSHSCQNIPGSYLCTCPDGYSLDADKIHCVDLDECQLEPCEHNCFNTPGSFYCSCNEGFTPLSDSPHLCVDLNECDGRTNAGCGHECVNTIGSYFCGCRKGFKLSSDGHSCEAKASFCPLLIAPTGGEMRCSRDLRGDAYPSGTVCTFKCPPGSALQGGDTRTCTAEGIWTNEPINCQVVKCPALSEVDHGQMSPRSCTRSISPVGQKCYLTCSFGFRVIGNPIRTCNLSGHWDPNNPQPFCEKNNLEPFIQCPSDVTVDLAPHQQFAYVRLPPPKSNVDWYRSIQSERRASEDSLDLPNTKQRFVESSPEWAKQLESDLPSGRTTVTFTARSPQSGEEASCTFAVFVRDKEDPQVFGCPKPFTVYLNTPDSSETVTWKEPVFKDNIEVVHIYKSMEPGRRLNIGTYPVQYIAIDSQGNRAKCSFVITVEAAPPVQRVFQPSQVWVVCPDSNNGHPIQMNVWSVPPACTAVSTSVTANHVQWDITRTPSEVPDVRNAIDTSPPQKKEPSLAASAYDTQIAASAYSSNSNSGRGQIRGSLISSSSALSVSDNEGITKPPSENVRTRHHHGFEAIYGESFPFSNLFRGYETMALAHARASGGRGEHKTSAYAHTSGNQHTQAIAHARARIYKN